MCFVTSVVPVHCASACVAPLYKGKGDRCECTSFKGINLWIVIVKVYGRVLIKKISKDTKVVICKEQGDVRKESVSVDQMFAVRHI